MKRTSIFLTMILMLAAAVSFSTVNAANKDLPIGKTVENFQLPDTDGKMRSFDDLKGKNGAIIVFLSVQCPVVRAYNERISQLAADYKAKGINVIGINSNATESPDAVKTHAQENYKFPVLIDKGNVFADKLSATATPEMFFFDASGKLIYHGAIDNDRSGNNISAVYLRDALNENLAGKAVTKAETKAFGCSIKRAAGSSGM